MHINKNFKLDQTTKEWAQQAQGLNVSLEMILISIKILSTYETLQIQCPSFQILFTASVANLAHQCNKHSITKTMQETIINKINRFLIILN